MNYLFSNFNLLKSLNDISQWNICNFKNLMYILHMPYYSTSLTLKLEYDIAKFDFSNINIVKSNIYFSHNSLTTSLNISNNNLNNENKTEVYKHI